MDEIPARRELRPSSRPSAATREDALAELYRRHVGAVQRIARRIRQRRAAPTA